MNEPVADGPRGAGLAIAGRVVPGLRRLDGLELDEHGAVGLSVALEHGGLTAPSQIATAGDLDRRPREGDVVGGVAIGIGDVHVDDDVGLGHTPSPPRVDRYADRWRVSRSWISSATALGSVSSKSMSFAHVGLTTIRTIDGYSDRTSVSHSTRCSAVIS